MSLNSNYIRINSTSLLLSVFYLQYLENTFKPETTEFPAVPMFSHIACFEIFTAF